MKYPVHIFQKLHACIRLGFKLLNPEYGLSASQVINMHFLGKGVLHFLGDNNHCNFTGYLSNT